jgi:two-component system LytT family response regulator
VTLRIIVADDELQARKRVVRLLEELPEVTILAACASAEEVIGQLSLRPDVLVLDISMPGIGGLELRRRLGDAGPSVIFVTAHAEHAVDAFDAGAVDYVVKPVTGARLAKAIDRCRRVPLAPTFERLPIATRAGVVLVDPRAVIYAAFDGSLVTLHGALESWITTASLTELEAQLPATFVRVDRRHLINLDEIVRLEPEDTGGYVAVTRSAARVPVSRQAGRDLRKRLGL